MLGKKPIKWRQHPDMAVAVDWDAKTQIKQTNFHFGRNCLDKLYLKLCIVHVHVALSVLCELHNQQT